jgi:Holliday junction DNA helicase RuvA
MISLLRGKIDDNKNGQILVLTTGGVGYSVFGSLTGLKKWKTGNEETILTYLVVRENAMELYGFVDDAERELFLHLIQVSGVGPKTALHILSLGTNAEISLAIARGDLNYLTKVSGIGKKTAERIIVELKEKVLVTFDDDKRDGSGVLGDVVEGLVSLGYAVNEAREVVKKLNVQGKTTEQILREALQNIK